MITPATNRTDNGVLLSYMNLDESALAPLHFSAGTVEKLVESQLFSIIRITMIYVHSWAYLQAEFGVEERIERERGGSCVWVC
jgi:hypothetical protein